MVADASIVDGRLEPGRRRGWNVCGSGVPVCRVPDVIRASVGWGLLGESSDEDSSGSLVGDSSESLEASV